MFRKNGLKSVYFPLSCSFLAFLMVFMAFPHSAVFAQNPQPTPSQTISAEVSIPVPPLATTGQCTELTASTTVLNGTLVNSGTARALLAYFEWGLSTEYGNLTDPIALGSGGQFSTLLRNIKADTEYHYRAIVVGHEAGTSVGSDAVFRTFPNSVSTLDQPISSVESVEPAKTTVEVKADEESIIRSPGEKVTLTVPKGAVNSTTKIELAEFTIEKTGGSQIVTLLEFGASTAGSGEKVSAFNKSLTLSIQHSPHELQGLDVDSLCVYYLDENSKEWVAVPCRFDPTTMIMTAEINHFSLYSEIANSLVSGPGRIMAAQVDLHSGAATYSYPIELPPGPGGFQPRLELNYNSGSVDEMKDKRATGSWVGIGWSLGLGKITKDLLLDRYFLEFSSGSYELISFNGSDYFTKPESHFKISKSGDLWQVWDTSGVYYKFGGVKGTDTSVQYLPDSEGGVYRWDLALMRDTNGNEATVVYYQEKRGSPEWVRSAYPQTLKYGLNGTDIEVQFHISADAPGTPDGDLRLDNPRTQGANAAPKIMETRQLDYIDIFIGNPQVRIRKYVFTYNTAPEYAEERDSDVVGGMYYSGQHRLLSIKQIGVDGTLALPETSFTYGNKSVYRSAPGERLYGGNPGNPASLTWPFLTIVANGFGGTVTFSYQQLGENLPNIWSRQAVISKVVDSAISPPVETEYRYAEDLNPDNGVPEYFGSGWDQQYRGFRLVIEEDFEGNHTKHYYYTTGTINGKDAERLTGKEYDTKVYSSADTLLKETLNEWDWQLTGSGTQHEFSRTWSLAGAADDITASGGYVYTFNTASKIIRKYTTFGTLLNSWTAPADTVGVAASDGFVYALGTSSGNVVRYDDNGGSPISWPYYPGLVVNAIAAADNKVYILTPYPSPAVAIYSPDGIFLPPTYSLTPNPPASAAAIAASSGKIFIWDSAGSGSILRVIEGQGGFQTIIGSAPAQAFGGMASDEGFLYIVGGAPPYPPTVGKYDAQGTMLYSWIVRWFMNPPYPNGIAAANGAHVEVLVPSLYSNGEIDKFIDRLIENYKVELKSTTVITGNTGAKTSKIRFAYDSHGNVITEYIDGDLSTNADDSTTWKAYFPNTISAYILNKTASERVYEGIVTSDTGGTGLRAQILYYYDGHTLNNEPPTKGNLTRVQEYKNASEWINTTYTYDTYGNLENVTDPNGNVTETDYEAVHHIYPVTKLYPVTGLSETFTYDHGTSNLVSSTDFNGQITMTLYDNWKRPVKVIKPGDTEQSPSVRYEYNDWGDAGEQHVKIITKIDGGSETWESHYFDGLGRIVQIHSPCEASYTIISNTVVYNSSGLVDKEFVTQNILTSQVDGYKTPDGAWKYELFEYDALGRVTTQFNIDESTWVSNDFSTPWQTTTTNERLYKTRYYFDAFQRLVKVQELNGSEQVYSTTEYTYDIFNRLTQSKDNSNNTTSVSFNWLGWKTSMTDPDMGGWQYTYDAAGNLLTQTDAKSQTITFSYDDLNRCTGKTYPQGSDMTNVEYTYDDATGGNFGKGQRTGMVDAAGSIVYIYDNWGRLKEETRTIGAGGGGGTSYGLSFDGSDSVSLTGSAFKVGETQGTGASYEFWVKANAPGAQAMVLMSKGSINPYIATDGTLCCDFFYADQSAYYASSGVNVANGAWHYVALTHDGTTSKIYIDGVLRANQTHAQALANTYTQTLFLGRSVFGGLFFTGLLDEVRASSTARTQTEVTAAWAIGAGLAFITDGSTVGLYHMDDQAATLTDSSGNSRNGTIGGATYTTGFAFPGGGGTSSDEYTTSYEYDGLSRIISITYPNGDVVENEYNNRGLPLSVESQLAGGIVTSASYNQLGDPTEINFNNGLKTTFGYYGFDTTGGHYGSLWEIKTLPQGTGTTLQHVRYTWDAKGNMSTRQNVLASETETFTYDFLDRLTAVSGPYTHGYQYNEIGNIISMTGVTYSYGSKPHAVTSVGSASYTYDLNGNMTSRNGQTIEWDVENRPLSVSGGAGGGGGTSYGLSFDGSDSVSLTGSAFKVGETQGTGASYEFWVKANAPGAQAMVLMSKGSINPYIATDGTLCCDFFYADQSAYYASSGVNVANGAWHYVALTHDGTTSKIYIDGVLRANQTHAQALANTYTQTLFLGRSVFGGLFFTGLLDEVRASSTARTQTEVTAAWASGAGLAFITDGSTVGLYHMDDQAATLTDSSGNARNGTISGATYTTGFAFPGGGGSPAADAEFVYDGDGQRIMKVENDETIVYINQYYEKNVTTDTVTAHYYFGDRLVAERVGTTKRFIHQDSLSSVTLVTDASGNKFGSSASYFPFGSTRAESVSTDEQFTGQKKDSTGLYYYNARYYDPAIGRFISPDSVGQNLLNPQTLNRYTYVLNNPLKYTDPSGHWIFAVFAVIRVAITIYNVVTTAKDIVTAVQNPTPGNILMAAVGVLDPSPGNKAGKVAVGLVDDAVTTAAKKADDVIKATVKQTDEVVEQGTKQSAKQADATEQVLKSSTDDMGDKGVIYLRIDKNTGNQYVGQAKSLARYEARKSEHKAAGRKIDADYDFVVIGRAKSGRDLDVLEQKRINQYGGVGVLENKRNQIAHKYWQYYELLRQDTL